MRMKVYLLHIVKIYAMFNGSNTKQSYSDDELLKAKVDLLSKTNMITYYQDTYQKLYKSEPQGMQASAAD